MKTFFTAALFALCASAFATDYNSGQCPVGGPFNPYPAGQIGGTAGPSICGGVSQGGVATFSDTWTFTLGDWPEFYGIWTYTSSTQTTASGFSGLAPCVGRGCTRHPYAAFIDSALLDGVPMAPPLTGLTWTAAQINLSKGTHVLTVTGHASGDLTYAKWGWQAQGILYKLTALPPCTEDCGGD